MIYHITVIIPSGTLVGVVSATDADKAHTPHSKISYSILKQEPSDPEDLFYIDGPTGSVFTRSDSLDREVRQCSTA